MPYFFYLLRCSDNSLYSGITTDLTRRVREHNGQLKGVEKGAKYTRVRRPVQLVYSEQFASRSEASKREYEVKHMDKEEKEQLLKD